jgi:hypothetical protein
MAFRTCFFANFPEFGLTFIAFHALGSSFPMSGLNDFSVSRKSAIPLFRWYRVCRAQSSDRQTIALGTGELGVIYLTVNRFSTKIPAKLEMLRANRDNQIVGKLA